MVDAFSVTIVVSDGVCKATCVNNTGCIAFSTTDDGFCLINFERGSQPTILDSRPNIAANLLRRGIGRVAGGDGASDRKCYVKPDDCE